jgi:hypothetical protein
MKIFLGRFNAQVGIEVIFKHKFLSDVVFESNSGKGIRALQTNL